MENVDGLESIHGVGHITADRLRQSGYGSFEKLAAATPEGLKAGTGLNITSAAKIIRAAAEILEEAMPRLPEEPEPSQEETALEDEPACEEPVETSIEEPAEASAEEPVEIPTSSSPIEEIVAQVTNDTAMYALTEIAEQIAAAVRDLPDIGKKFLKEVRRNPDLKTVVVSRTAERLADAIAD